MSMQKIPLTPIEEAGLRAHGLGIGTPSQLSDAFRQGVRYARAQQSSQGGEEVEVVAWANPGDLVQDGYSHSFGVSSEEYAGRIPLMTVAQHNRIMAAATLADSRVVPVDLLERLIDPYRRVPRSIHLHNNDCQQLRALLEQNQ